MSLKQSFTAISLFLVTSLVHANSPPEPAGFGFILPNESATPGESVSFDISGNFSDPDGDDLDYFVEPWSRPLPTGLNLDSDTGAITGVFPDLGNEIARFTFFYAQDPFGERSGTLGFVVWVPVSYGPVADLFYRTCDPAAYECIPGYNFNVQPRGSVLQFSPEGALATSVFPEPPTQEETRMSASVGYDGEELTPAISTFLRPGNERMTGNQLGISKHLQTGDINIEATLTYSQTGGVLGPAASPLPGELPFGAVGSASLFAFELLPEANGKLDGSLCDWATWGGQGGSFRALVSCVQQGLHSHVVNLQVSEFDVPETGNAVQGDLTVTPAVTGGTASASLFRPYPGLPDPEVYVGIELFTIARYGGEADSQNTLLVTFDDPGAMEPVMENVTEPSFTPAPESGGVLEVDVNFGQCIKINGHGIIPVIIFGNEDIDASEIDNETVTFGSFQLATRGNGKVNCSVEDVDFDLFDDLVCKFLDDGSDLQGAPGSVLVSASLTGTLEIYYGEDEVCLD